jgi:hypothetical protein
MAGVVRPHGFQPPRAGFRYVKASQAFTPPYGRRGVFAGPYVAVYVLGIICVSSFYRPAIVDEPDSICAWWL